MRSIVDPCVTESEYDEVVQEALLQYILRHDLQQVYLMGHSFGAFHALHFAHRNPRLVNRLLLVAPAGVFPVPARTGSFCSPVFAFGLPMRPLRALGSVGVWLFTAVCWATGQLSTRLQYWYQVQACAHSLADCLINKYFELTLHSCTWGRPAFRE